MGVRAHRKRAMCFFLCLRSSLLAMANRDWERLVLEDEDFLRQLSAVRAPLPVAAAPQHPLAQHIPELLIDDEEEEEEANQQQKRPPVPYSSAHAAACIRSLLRLEDLGLAIAPAAGPQSAAAMDPREPWDRVNAVMEAVAARASAASHAPAPPPAAAAAAATTDSSKPKNECCICLERPLNTVSSPCGHMTCFECSQLLGVGAPCPQCRKPITAFQRCFGL